MDEMWPMDDRRPTIQTTVFLLVPNVWNLVLKIQWFDRKYVCIKLPLSRSIFSRSRWNLPIQYTLFYPNFVYPNAPLPSPKIFKSVWHGLVTKMKTPVPVTLCSFISMNLLQKRELTIWSNRLSMLFQIAFLNHTQTLQIRPKRDRIIVFSYLFFDHMPRYTAYFVKLKC